MSPHVGVGSVQVCESVGKADLLSDHFNIKQCTESVYLLLTCHSFARLITFSFRTSEVRRLLLGLYPYGGTSQLDRLPLVLKKTDDLSPRLSVLFWRFLRL